MAASLSAALRFFEPLRVLPDRRLPADWSLPGHWPAHEARCPAEANTLMSGPISARMISAGRWGTPGVVPRSSAWGGERGAFFPLALSRRAVLSCGGCRGGGDA